VSQPPHVLFDLDADVIEEVQLIERIGAASEDKILPDKEPVSVAQVVESLILVESTARDIRGWICTTCLQGIVADKLDNLVDPTEGKASHGIRSPVVDRNPAGCSIRERGTREDDVRNGSVRAMTFQGWSRSRSAAPIEYTNPLQEVRTPW